MKLILHLTFGLGTIIGTVMGWFLLNAQPQPDSNTAYPAPISYPAPAYPEPGYPAPAPSVPTATPWPVSTVEAPYPGEWGTTPTTAPSMTVEASPTLGCPADVLCQP